MKTLYTIIFLFIAAALFAQSPNNMSYQALVRDLDNKLVPNSSIGIQISILHKSNDGISLYVERHFPTTNMNGLVTVVIGSGTIVSGDITAIDWSDGPYFIKSETDIDGGANYTIQGTSELLSVPYALYSNIAETVSTENDPVFGASAASSISSSNITNWNNKLDSEVDGSTTNEIQELSKDGTNITLSNGGGTLSIADNDNSTTNELQTLSILDKTLSISDKNSITLPSGLTKTTILNVSCESVSSIGTSYKKITDIGTFSKSSSSSIVEAVFNGRIAVTGSFVGSTGATFELRIDNSASKAGRARAVVKADEGGNSGVPVTMTGIFSGLSLGNHTFSIWVKTLYGSVSEAMVDPGCWSTDVVVLKEY